MLHSGSGHPSSIFFLSVAKGSSSMTRSSQPEIERNEEEATRNSAVECSVQLNHARRISLLSTFRQPAQQGPEAHHASCETDARAAFSQAAAPCAEASACYPLDAACCWISLLAQR